MIVTITLAGAACRTPTSGGPAALAASVTAARDAAPERSETDSTTTITTTPATTGPIGSYTSKYEWHQIPAATPERTLTFGLRTAANPATARTVVLIPGSDGLAIGHFTLADALVERGVNVVVACWFQPDSDHYFEGYMFDCRNGPRFTGMSSAAVADLDAIVTGARHLPGIDPRGIAVLGHSRGAGIAALRASRLHRGEPLILVSGLLTDPIPWWDLPGDEYLGPDDPAIDSPVMVVWAADDVLVTPRNSTDMLASLSANGSAPAALRYDTGGHSGMIDGPNLGDFAERVAVWLESAA